MNWLRITGAVSTSIIGIALLWGAYNYYFSKPVPIVNNYTVQPGANLNQTQNEDKYSSGPMIGIVAGPLMIGDDLGGFIGGMFSFKF